MLWAGWWGVGEAGRSQSGGADPRPPLDPSGQVGSTDVKPEQANLLSHSAQRSARTLRARRRAGGRPAPGPKALTVLGNTTRGKQTLTLLGPIPAEHPGEVRSASDPRKASLPTQRGGKEDSLLISRKLFQGRKCGELGGCLHPQSSIGDPGEPGWALPPFLRTLLLLLLKGR